MISDFQKWPDKIDILLSHEGPSEIRQNEGSSHLLKEVLKRNIPLHLFGHFHMGRGISSYRGTKFVCCSNVGPDDITLAKPVIIDYYPKRK